MSDTNPEPVEPRPGALGGFFAFLLGSRAAIESITLARGSILAGLLLTVSAGLARTYDTASLLHQPWMALRGIVVALANSLALFAIVFCATQRRSEPRRAFWPLYRAFLAAFLWTAPLAWLYAIPYERFLTPVEAINANLWTLAVVALWRVLLITRVLSLFLDRPYLAVLAWTLLWSDVVVFAATVASDAPVMDLMGALQNSPEDQARAGRALMTGMASLIAAPILFCTALLSFPFMRSVDKPLDPAPRARGRHSWVFVGLLLAAGFALLPFGQGEQVRRFRTERMLRSGQVAEALREMSAHSRNQYPPVWDPPPRMGYRESVPSMAALREAMAAATPAPWVQEMFLAKMRLDLRRGLPARSYREMGWSEIARELAEQSNESTVKPDQAACAAFLARHDPTLGGEDREALLRIARMPELPRDRDERTVP